MKTTTGSTSTATPTKPRAVKRQAHHSLCTNGGTGILLDCEAPTALAFVRNFWRTTRRGKLDSESHLHLSIRVPATLCRSRGAANTPKTPEAI